MKQAITTVNGVRVHFGVQGRGPDVLLIHGWASSRRMWAELAERLAGRYRCWSLDLPGCGDSDKPAGDWYTIPNFTATLHGFMAQHQLEPVRVIGHSMGGMIALHLAASHPQTVERLVAINPVVTGRANLRRLARRPYSRPALSLMLRLSPAVVVPALSHPWGRGVPGLHYVRRRVEDFGRTTADSLLGSGRAVVGFDVSPVLHQIAAPTLVLVGDRDLNVPAREGRLAARLIRDARLHVLRAGHLATDDQPAAVLQCVEQFLL